MNDANSDLDPVGKLAEAFLARYRRGERPSVTEYAEKYPELAEQIRDLFPALVLMEKAGSVEAPRSAFSAGTEVVGQRPLPQHLGDYRILREVGRGGMGIVYEAVQESLGRHVALKVFSTHGLLPATHLERFRREARAAARLHHTNIVPVHGVGEQDGVHYYAMQFIQGQGLDAVLQEVRRLRSMKGPSTADEPGPGADRTQTLCRGLLTGRFAGEANSGMTQVAVDPEASTAPGPAHRTGLTAQPDSLYYRSVARMGVQVAAGLDYAHQQGILHRDIKPSNLVLDARGTVWITDFGLAKPLASPGVERGEDLTQTGDIVGTLRYMAPERFHGWSDPRSDVYGLGVTLYELLTLRPAFADCDRPRLIDQVAHEDPPRPRKLDRSIPRDLETIVLKAIDKEPGRRYQTAAELGADLGRFLAGEPVRARRVGVWERAAKWARRRPAVAALLAVSAAALLTGILGSAIYNARLQKALDGAEANLEEARRADREKTQQLAISYFKEAQARRNGGQVGRRFKSLELLQKAAGLFRVLGQLDEQRTLELRNEAIACLALADLEPGKEWNPDPGWFWPAAFDPTLQYYVAHDHKPDVKGYVNQGHLSVRRARDREEVIRLPGFGVRAVHTQFSPDSRYLAAHYESGQRHNYVWDLRSGKALVKEPAHDNCFPAFSPDGRRVALAQADRSIRIWELPSGAKWKDLPPSLPVGRLFFHPDGQKLTIVSGGTVQLRDLSDGKELATFKHPGGVYTLAWRGDGKLFATGCWNHNIYLWEPTKPAQPSGVLKGHFNTVVYLGFSQRGDLLLSSSWDCTDRLWDPATAQQLVSKPAGWPFRHQIGPDDQGLECGWQMATGRECRTFHGHKGSFFLVAMSPDGGLLASVGSGVVRLWDLAATREGDKLLGTLPGARVQFDPKGESLITAGGAGLQRWPIAPDPETGGLRAGPPQSLGLSARAPLVGSDPDFALSADGRTVAYSPASGQALVFDLGNPRQKLLIESPRLRHAAFSPPDGRLLATGNWQGRGVKVWNAQTGQPVHAFDWDREGPEEETAHVAFSPDGKWLVTATAVESAIWDVTSWQKKYGFRRENAGSTVGWAVFAPDGSMLALLHTARAVRLVNPVTGRELATLPAGGTPFCFSPDGSQLVTDAAGEGAFQVWDLRLIRRQLREMGLDWDLPSYPPPPPASTKPPRATVLPAQPSLPSKEGDARAYFERGLLYVQLRQYREAVGDFKRAGSLAPNQLAWEEIARAYSQVIERNPDDAEAYHQRAHARTELRHWPEAIDDFCQAIQRAPQRLGLHVCRGKAYLGTGEAAKAGEDFRKAGDNLKPKDANNLAWELATARDPLRRDPKLAVELARHATRRAPEATMYWNTLGVAYYRAREWTAAIKALEEAERLAPGKHLGFNAFFLAMCHQQLGDAAKARDLYDRAVRWCQETQGAQSAAQQQELQAFRAEAEALVKPPPAGP
jgi:serine/threonine protein kinase/WD40 repeat protein/Tfp pilus assembly protein PilF